MASLISVGQVIDQTVHHYRKYFKNLLRVSLYIFAGLPLFIAGAAIYSNDSLSRMLIAISLQFLGALVTGIASIWSFNALIFTVDAEVGNKKLKTDSLSKAAWRKFWPSLAISVLVAVALIIGTVLCLLPGAAIFLISVGVDSSSMLSFLAGIVFLLLGGIIAACLVAWVGVTMLFAPYSLLLENNNVFDSLRHARDLLRGRWWPTLLRVLIPKITILIIAFFLQQILAIIVSLLAAGAGAEFIVLFSIISDIMRAGFTALITPLFVIADYYVFQSLLATYESETAA